MATSPLTEADSSSLDFFFSQKPPFPPEVLAEIKREFRRLRAKYEADAASGVTSTGRAKKAPKVPQSTEITMDIFGAEEAPSK